MSCLFVFYVKTHSRTQDRTSHEIANKPSNIIQWFIFNEKMLSQHGSESHPLHSYCAWLTHQLVGSSCSIITKVCCLSCVWLFMRRSAHIVWNSGHPVHKLRVYIQFVSRFCAGNAEGSRWQIQVSVSQLSPPKESGTEQLHTRTRQNDVHSTHNQGHTIHNSNAVLGTWWWINMSLNHWCT